MNASSETFKMNQEMSEEAKEDVVDNKIVSPEKFDDTRCPSPVQISQHSEHPLQNEIPEESLQNKSDDEQNVSNIKLHAESPKELERPASGKSSQHSEHSTQHELPEEYFLKKPNDEQNVSNSKLKSSLKEFERPVSNKNPVTGTESDSSPEISSVKSTSSTTDSIRNKKQKKRFEKVIEIIRDDKVERLKKLYEKGQIGNLKSPKWKQMTLLHWAAMYGALECIFWLLEDSEVTPNATAKNRWTPVHIATMKGQDASVEAILNSHRYTVTLDYMGRCGLHLAAAHGHTYTLNTLLRRGLLSEIEIQDVNGWTPIFHAVHHNRVGCIQSLILHGAITDHVDREGNSLVHLAAMEGHIEALRLLFYSGHPVNGVHFLIERNNEGFKPSMLAKRYYKREISDHLVALERGTFLRDNFENIVFPGHMAAARGKVEVLKNLLDKDVVKINEPDTYGYTILHRAVVGGNKEIVKWLLYMKADYRIRNNVQETPLDTAIRCKEAAIAEIIRREMEEEEEEGDPVESRDDPQIRFDPKKRLSMKRRCEERVNHCLHSLKTAIENFRQVGGTLDITDAHVKLVSTLKESERQIFELKDQLAYDRLVRETIQGELDKKQRELNNLKAECRKMNLITTRNADTKYISKNDPSRFKTTPKRKKSPSKKQRRRRNSGVFLKVKKE